MRHLPSATSTTSSAGSIQRILGSRRNHDRCRRTNRRVALAVSATACAIVSRAVDPPQELGVTERPRRGHTIAKPDGRERPYLVHQAVGEHDLHPVVRSVRRARWSSRSSPICTASYSGVVVRRKGSRERLSGECITSSARTILRPFSVRSPARPLGRRAASLLVQPLRAKRRERPPPAGTQPRVGTGKTRSGQAQRRIYRPLPPTRTGVTPRASRASIQSRPRCW